MPVINGRGAGADTTSIGIRAVFDYLMRNPQHMNRLQSEIDDFYESQKLSTPITYAQTLTLPFLQAVILEATRLFPSIIYQLPRHSPEEGITIDGKQIPRGVDIGISTLTMNRDKAIFGDDAEMFRPERWLADKDKARYMEARLTTVYPSLSSLKCSLALVPGPVLGEILRFLRLISLRLNF